LCDLILSQHVGLAAVDRERQALNDALGAFDPSTVASLDVDRVGHLLGSPLFRDARKIQTCIAAANSWRQAAGDRLYVTRLARVAAEDDALRGWPALVTMLRKDFAGINDAMAAALLKRWGFFSSLTHLGVQRLLSRLGLIDGSGDGSAVQAFLVRVADVSGSTPYAVEGALAIFAGTGPCRAQARCEQCPLSGRCPSSSIR
jgi:3-methyladenine DNA glycosylase Tag